MCFYLGISCSEHGIKFIVLFCIFSTLCLTRIIIFLSNTLGTPHCRAQALRFKFVLAPAAWRKVYSLPVHSIFLTRLILYSLCLVFSMQLKFPVNHVIHIRYPPGKCCQKFQAEAEESGCFHVAAGTFVIITLHCTWEVVCYTDY